MLPSGAVASPRPDVLQRELEAFREIAESTQQPEFEVTPPRGQANSYTSLKEPAWNVRGHKCST